jgi:hypothetical protein
MPGLGIKRPRRQAGRRFEHRSRVLASNSEGDRHDPEKDGNETVDRERQAKSELDQNRSHDQKRNPHGTKYRARL